MARAPVTLTALVSLLAACAPSPDAVHAARSTELCWWRGTRWEDRAPLLLRGSRLVLGHARGRWEGGVWRGAHTSGALRRAGPTVLFEGAWHGGGLTVHADVDATTEAIFRAWEPKRLEAGLVLRGTPLRLLDAKVGEVLAAPSREALAAFVPNAPAVLATSCEGLTLISPGPAEDEPRRLLARAGFDANAEEVRVRAGAPATPDGAWTPWASEERAFVVGREAGVVRLALPSQGLVWVTWAGEGDVTPAPTPSTSAQEPARAHAASTQNPVRRCDDGLPLFVEVREQVVEIGRLESAGFRVVRMKGELVAISPVAEWLELAPGLELLAPAWTAGCAEVGSGS